MRQSYVCNENQLAVHAKMSHELSFSDNREVVAGEAQDIDMPAMSFRASASQQLAHK